MKILFALALVGSLSVAGELKPSPDFIIGLWWTEKKDAKVEIFKQDQEYFGKLAWVKDDPGSDGKPVLDDQNPDPKLRTRPLRGLVFIKNLHPTDDASEWRDGRVYDADNGKTYHFKISRIENQTDRVRIRGYLGISLLGGSETWTRAR